MFSLFLKHIWPQKLVTQKKKKQPNDIYKAKEENMLIELANDSKFKRISDIKNSREILQRHVN